MADENATQDDVDGAVKLLQASVDKAEEQLQQTTKNQAHLVKIKAKIKQLRQAMQHHQSDGE